MTPRAAVVVHCRRSYHEAKDGDGDIKDGAETKMLDCRGGFFRRDFSYACVNTSLHIHVIIPPFSSRLHQRYFNFKRG